MSDERGQRAERALALYLRTDSNPLGQMLARDVIALEAERDALLGRVTELEAALAQLVRVLKQYTQHAIESAAVARAGVP